MTRILAVAIVALCVVLGALFGMVVALMQHINRLERACWP